MKSTYPFSRDVVNEVLTKYFPGTHTQGDEVHGDNLPTQEEFAAKVTEYLEAERITSIRTEAESRITLFAGNDLERIRQLAESVVLIYQGIRPTLSTALQNQLDDKLAIFNRIQNIRTEAARLIADPSAIPNWPA